MKKNLFISSISILTSIILLGCGSGGGSSVLPSDTTATGTFIDAEVIGASYQTTSGLSGKTDTNGHFKYKKGDKVKFKIGKLLLGEATPSTGGLITPAELTSNEQIKILLLRVLQAIDEDNNPSNGITIPTDLITSLEDINETNIQDLNETTILDLSSNLKDHLDEDHDGNIDVDENTAKEHFQLSLNQWHAKYDKGIGFNNAQGQNRIPQVGSVVDVSKYATYTLNQAVKEALSYMGNEERLAYDIYKNLYEYHLDRGVTLSTLNNIADRSEKRHISTVRSIVDKYNLTSSDLTNLDRDIVGDGSTDIDSIRGQYDIQHIQDLYDALYSLGTQSAENALKVGCMVEVTDINDLNEKIIDAQEIYAQDIVDAFTSLRKGSYNHYWAFDKALKDMGTTEGCCSLGTIDGINYCHTEYPQNSHGRN